MKKYVKPTVEVVNLKSSNDIATSFDQIRGTLVKDYLSTQYTVSTWSNVSSADALSGSVEG